MAVTFYFARHGETQFNIAGKVQGWSDSPLSPYGMLSAYRLGTGLAEIDFVGACASDSQRAQDTLSLALEARENERLRLRSRFVPLTLEMLRESQVPFPSVEEFGESDEIAALELFLRTKGGLGPVVSGDDDGAEPAAVPTLVRSEGWHPDSGSLEGLTYPTFRLASQARMREGQGGLPVPVRIDTRLREWCFGDLEGQPMVKLRNRLYDLFGEDLPREQQNRRIDEIADYLHKTDKTHRAESFAAISTRVASFLDDCGSAVARYGGGNVLVVTHAMFIRALVFMFAEGNADDPSRIENASLTKVVWDAGAVKVEAISDTSHFNLGQGREGAGRPLEGAPVQVALSQAEPARSAPSSVEDPSVSPVA